MYCIMSRRGNWHWLWLQIIAIHSHYCPGLHFRLNADYSVLKKLLFPLIKLDNAIRELFLDQCSPYFNGNQWKISRLLQEEIKVQIQSQKNSPWRFVRSKAHWWPTAFPGLNALRLPWKCWGPDGTISCYFKMSYQILLLVHSQISQRFEISYQILAPVHHQPVVLH